MSRPEGLPNKNKQFLLKRLQDMYGADFHPIMNMASNAMRLQSIVDEAYSDGAITPDLLIDANKAWEGIAQYVEPKLKAVEISGDQDKPIKIDSTVTFVGVNADSN